LEVHKKSGRNAKTSGLKVSAAKDGDLEAAGCAHPARTPRPRFDAGQNPQGRFHRNRNIPAAIITITTASAHTHHGGGHRSQKIVSCSPIPEILSHHGTTPLLIRSLAAT